MTFGIARLLEDLKELGYEQTDSISDGGGNAYALIKDFEVSFVFSVMALVNSPSYAH